MCGRRHIPRQNRVEELASVLLLRDEVRNAVLAGCGEPDTRRTGQARAASFETGSGITALNDKSLKRRYLNYRSFPREQKTKEDRIASPGGN